MANIIAVDVLVVGGGGAAARAALEAHYQGASVAMVVKGYFGKSGATAYQVAEIAGYNVADAAVDNNDNPNEHFNDIVNAAAGMCDENLAYILAHEALPTVADLESMGVHFEKENGKYLEIVGCFASRPRTHVIKGHAEPILRALKQRIQNTSIQIIENSIITDLLIQDGQCYGAVGLDNEGQVFLVQAGAVALATGGAGQLFKRNLNPHDITGDGYAMAFRAGADLVNMEFMQAGLGVLTPKYNIFNGWIWMMHPNVLNSYKNEFLHNYIPSNLDLASIMDQKSTHYPFSTFDQSFYIESAIHKEVLAGRGTERGGVFIDLRKASEVNISGYERGEENSKMWNMTKAFLLKNNIDPNRDMLEVGCFGHAINGGVRIDQTTESTVRGLYAAGETAGGPHGADRLGGNMILTCQVFGKRMGIYAAERAKAKKNNMNIEKLGSSEIHRLENYKNLNGIIRPRALKQRIADVMWRTTLVVRNQEKLEHCLEEMSLIRKIFSSDLVVSNSVDLRNAIEVENMITVSEIIANAALLRTESRGSHYREDFPKRNDELWLKSILIRKDKDQGIKLSKEKLPILDLRKGEM